MNFVEELRWRGMIQDVMPGTEEQLQKESTSGYVGIDPTADSLHIGHLVSVMILRHFQQAGHRPIALIGGATGMIGDPSLKSQERNLLDEPTLRHNQESIKKQLGKFLDFPNDDILKEKINSVKESEEGYRKKVRNAFFYIKRYRSNLSPSTRSKVSMYVQMIAADTKIEISESDLKWFVSDKPNAAMLVNNYDWMKGFSFLNFIRDIGKHITVNYMMAKDSVKKRLSGDSSDGMSFTEFSYQLLQGYDFLHLYRSHGCRIQMGGSDQWGNITTGTELIRKIDGGEAYALVCPLITKADGTKFGKTESGNIWLDRRYTSPYKFYQFWFNVSDADAEKYIKIFTSLTQGEINELVAEQVAAPQLRALQKRLAKEVTIMVHSEKDYETAVDASAILFGNATAEALKSLDEETFLQVFEGVPVYSIAKSELSVGIKLVDLLTDTATVFPSKGELRKTVQAGGVAINKNKIESFEHIVGISDLIANKYIIVQKGKKNYFLLVAN